MRYRIQDIEGIGPAYGDKLGGVGISSTNDLLRLCCDARGRRHIAERSGISEAMLLKWANLADLMRIRGVASEYSELLEAAGVDTVKELRNRNPENLAAAMQQVNAEKKLTRAIPSLSAVTSWVEQARDLEPVISH